MTVFTLNPKWGGRLEGFDRVLAIAKAARMTAKEIEYLEYRIEMEKADYYEIVSEEKTIAASHYKKAGELCETFKPWEKVAHASYDTADWPIVIEASNHLIDINPTRGYLYRRRGWAYEKTTQMARAIKDYEIASELGSHWAQNKLGWLLWQGIYLPKDLERAKKLFTEAAGQGNRNAPANLKAINAILSQQDN
jgi:TPR repeat protein